MHRFLLIALDLACVAIATVGALLLRDNLEPSLERLVDILPYLALSLISAAVVFPLSGTQRPIWRYSTLSDYLRVLTAVLLAVLGAVSLGFALNRLEGVARALPVLQGILLVALMTMVRIAQRVRQTLRLRQAPDAEPPGVPKETVLVIGINAVAELFLRAVAEQTEERIHIAGVVGRNERHSGRSFHNHAILGTPEHLPGVLKELEVHGVFVDRIVVTQAFAQLMPAAREALEGIEAGSDIVVDYFAERLGLVRPRPQIGATPPQSAGRPKRSLQRPLEDAAPAAVKGLYWSFKRAFDAVGATVLLVLFAPLMALIGLLVVLDVGRPALFWQLRPGALGRPFKLYKFRTMRAAHDAEGRRIPDELRVSGLGRFLRRSRLDELPQLFQILIGEMSFVGPRPLLPVDQAPQHVGRLAVRPGLTGWAQVNGGREVSAADKAAMDIWYVHNASFKLDLIVALRTVLTVLFGERMNRAALGLARRDLGAQAGEPLALMDPYLPASGGAALEGGPQRRVA